MLDYVETTMSSTGTTTADYFKIKAPKASGLQITGNPGSCVWPMPDSDESDWIRMSAKVYLVRCGLGAVSSSIEIWAKAGLTGTPYLLKSVAVGQSWHRANHRVTYYIQNPLFKNPGETPEDFTTAIPLAEEVWDNVSSNLTIAPSATRAGADVVIVGYRDPIPSDRDGDDIKGDDGTCLYSIACTYPSGTHPHIGAGQLFYIENPPHWGNLAPRIWTNDYDKFDEDRDVYQHLPSTLVHEFGHTLGLAHGINSDDVMRGGKRNFAADCDQSSGVCGLRSNDKMGLVALYDHHAQH